MRRTRWTSKVIDFQTTRMARLKAKRDERRARRADVTRLVDARAQPLRASPPALALAFVFREGLPISDAQELLWKWLLSQPEGTPLSHYDLTTFCELLKRLIAFDHEALELVRFDWENTDDDDGTRLAEAG